MALGVLNNLSAIYAENNLNNTSNSLQTVLQQLSSGSKINSGADDSAGLSLVNGLQANSTALSQSQTNAQEGVGLLDVADGALSQVTNLLDRAITLATEASNGTLDSSQEAAANQEYTSIMSEINNIGSTTTYNQQQVFTGNTVAIYTGDSSTAGSSIDDLNIRSLSESSVGDTGGQMSYSTGQNNVFIDLSNDGKNAAVTDSLNASGTTTVNLSYLTKGTAGSVTTANATIVVGTGTSYTNTAQGLISAINASGLGLSATFATATQAGTAATAAAKASQNGGGSGTDTGIEISAAGIGVNTTTAIGAGVVGALSMGAGDTLGGTLSIVGADGTNHNITLGAANSTDTLANLAATINTDDFGVTAQVSGTTLTFLSADSAVAVSGTSLTQTTAASAAVVSVVNSGLAIHTAGTVGTITDTAANDVLSGKLTITGTNGASYNGASGITLGTPGTTDTLADLANYINGLQATTPALGVTASVNNNVLTLSTTVTGAGTSAPSVAAVGAAATSPAVTSSISLSDTPTTTQSSSTIGTLALPNTYVTSGDLLSGALKIGSNTITLGTTGVSDTLANLKATINSGLYGVTASLNSAGTALTFNSTNSALAISSTATDTTDGAAALTYTADTSTGATSSQYYNIGISGTITDTSTTVGVTNGGTANVGIVADSNGIGGTATISYSDGAGQSLSNTDLLNQTDAAASLTALSTAISDVAAMDGYIGAQINTLNSIGQVLTTQQENVTSAQNAIQATDYASATAAMSKYEILSQTGIAALAQANTVQQEVTKLLQ